MAISKMRTGGRRHWSIAINLCFALAASFSLTACVTTTGSSSSNILSPQKQTVTQINANSQNENMAEGDAASVQTASLPGAQSRSEDLIDQTNCARGLSGSMATSLAGGVLLTANNLSDGKTFVQARVAPMLTSEELMKSQPAPSAGTSDAFDAAAPKTGFSSPTEGLLIAAYQQTGRHYSAGGQSPATGFDASGFTRWVYGQRGITLPHQASQQAIGGRQVPKEELKPGDLLVYRDPTGQTDQYHVGIYTGQGNFLHAAAKSGVVTETAAFGPQYSPYFVSGRRYFDDPKAAPLSEGQKMAAASSAVKLALSELGPNDKPDRSTPKAKSKAGKKKKS
ncbi:C40 family peptidase [Deltaproteobacteria bacterium OttesenSCG-928-K17]|nr:C40 family peptidase [Deltaproteobacteria bacterium OttesenSCG-928-K17]